MKHLLCVVGVVAAAALLAVTLTMRALADNDPQKLAADVEQYRKDVESMTANQAADGWLTLHDSTTGQTGLLLDVLSPPTAWEALAKRIDARPLPGADAPPRDLARAQALRLVGAALTNDRARQRESLAAIHSLIAEKGQVFAGMDSDQLRELALSLAAEAGDPAVFTAWLSINTGDPQRAAHEELGYGEEMELPDLVRQFGAEKAERLLRELIVSRKQFSIDRGEQTQSLARKLTTELVEELKVPRWRLVDFRTPELFEAMEKKFITDAPAIVAHPAEAQQRRQLTTGNYYYRQARGAYLLSLILAGRDADAMRVAQPEPKAPDGDEPESIEFTYDWYNKLSNRELVLVEAFLNKLLGETPSLPYWDEYAHAAAVTDNSKRLVERAREAYARKDLDEDEHAQLAVVLAKALLAAGDVDGGLKVAREVAAGGEPDVRREWAIRVARLGKLLERLELVNEGVAAARDVLAGQREHIGDYGVRELAKEVTEIMADTGDLAGAAELMAKLIVDNPNKNDNDSYRNEKAVILLGLYSRAGRHADVLELLATFPKWGAGDLAGIIKVEDAQGQPAGYLAALALADQKRDDDAKRVLDATLNAEPSFDPAYDLLVRLHQNDVDGLLARLDGLYKRDRYEERPLIWKAEVLRRAKRLDEAEQTIKAAVAIDPSDGEQHFGRRMRAYAVFADIMRDKGDEKQAKFFDGVVAAIRLSERADKFYEAGLTSQAIAMYGESLTHFSDAYCIQSRLAIQLAEAGKHDEAAKHYRRAYELMPDSFGRVESHCFGCEGAFKGATAQTVAEETFSRLARDVPNKPQVHYLLGYLREAQGRFADAAASYRRAVELDPDYLNAWKRLLDATSSVAERDEAALQMTRLDPLRRHATPDLSKVTDLRKLWEAAAGARRHAETVGAGGATTAGKPLFPLAASQAALGAADQQRGIVHSSRQAAALPGEPREVVAQTEVLAAARSVLDAQPGDGGGL